MRWTMPMEYAMEYADAEEFLMEYAVSPKDSPHHVAHEAPTRSLQSSLS